MQLIDPIAAEISAPRLTLIASTVSSAVKVAAASSYASNIADFVVIISLKAH